MLKIKNKHERDDNIIFIEEGHKYFVNGDDSFISVTTYIHTHFKQFDSEIIINKMKKSKNWKQSKYFGMTNYEIKKLWDDNGKNASSLGTKLHNDIEFFYNEIEIINDSIEWTYFKNFYNNNINKTPYRTEWTIYDENLKICGSIDMIFINDDGTLSIYDWKRCKEIKLKNDYNEYSVTPSIKHLHDCNYIHYTLQLNIYKKLIERNYGFTVKDLHIVCMHPDNDNNNYIEYKLPILNEEIDKLFQERLCLNNITEIEVTEKTYNDKIYFVDNKSNILDDDCNIIGLWKNENDIILF